MKIAPLLPLELVRRVADLCDVPSTKLSLVLLSRACHRDIVGILYRMIHISTQEQLVSLSGALLSGQPSLRLSPQSLRIHIRSRGTTKLADRIRDVLLVVDNLVELVLDVSVGTTLKLFDRCHPESITYRLKHFSHALNSRNHSELLKFLSHQNKLEDLICINPETWWVSSPPTITSTELSMPELKSLTAGAEIVLLLVPGRPVSHIYIYEWIPSQLTSFVISAILRTTAPLVYLNVSIPMSTGNDTGILAWLLGLSRFYESLEALTFRVGDWKFISGGSKDHFKSALSRFAAIRTFTVIGPDLVRPNGRQTLKPGGRELEQFSWWLKVCPSLRVVSFFGNELSAT
ncbi:hypothetical protein FRC09_016029 [Ceratobasidium sp. 395]|nr:hypothetical protein FRC09_016029 [Ceratobasidium sp. 395]